MVLLKSILKMLTWNLYKIVLYTVALEVFMGDNRGEPPPVQMEFFTLRTKDTFLSINNSDSEKNF